MLITRYEEGVRWRPRPFEGGEAMVALFDNAMSLRVRPQVILPVAVHVSGAKALQGRRGDAEEVAERVLSSIGPRRGSGARGRICCRSEGLSGVRPMSGDCGSSATEAGKTVRSFRLPRDAASPNSWPWAQGPAGAESEPLADSQLWSRLEMELVGTRLRVDAFTSQVVRAMSSQGLSPILLKGPAVARWLYAEDPWKRGYVDADLLLAPWEVDAARKILRGLGFELLIGWTADADPWHHAEDWHRPDGASVDLHRSLHGCEGVSDERVWNAVSLETDTLLMGGVCVAIPRLQARTLHVALHLNPVSEVPGSRPWVDLERAIRRVGLSTWEQAADIARDLGVSRRMGSSLSALPDGAALARRLGLPAAPSGVLFLYRESNETKVLVRMASLPNWRTRFRFGFQHLFPPSAVLEPMHPRIRRCWGIPFYAARVGRALLNLPPSLLAWRRIRQLSRDARSEV